MQISRGLRTSGPALERGGSILGNAINARKLFIPVTIAAASALKRSRLVGVDIKGEYKSQSYMHAPLCSRSRCFWSGHTRTRRSLAPGVGYYEDGICNTGREIYPPDLVRLHHCSREILSKSKNYLGNGNQGQGGLRMMTGSMNMCVLGGTSAILPAKGGIEVMLCSW